MFVVLSRFTITNDMTESVRHAFRNRPHLVDNSPGFVRMELLSPTDKPEQVWLITFWQNQPCFRQWRKSHAYHDSHKDMPQGLKLVPGSTAIGFFELFPE